MGKTRVLVLFLAVFGLLAVLTAACGGKATATPVPTATTRPAATATTAPTGSAADRGKAIVDKQGCLACHMITGTTVTVGPNLSKVGSKDEAYLRQSITDPNAVVAAGFPKDIMPKDYGKKLSSQQLDDLIAYLKTLK